MRLARGILLLAASIAATIILARPAAWLSKRHVESDDPRLLVEAAVGAMESPEAAERFYDLDRRLVEAGAAAVEPLTIVLANPRAETVFWAESALERIGSPAVPGLIRALSHPNAGVRRCALMVLSRFEPDARIIAAVPTGLDSLLTWRHWDREESFSHEHSSEPYMEAGSWSFARPDHPSECPGLSEEAVEALHEAIRAHPRHTNVFSAMLGTRARPWLVSPLADRLVAEAAADPTGFSFLSALDAWNRCVDPSVPSPLSAEQTADLLSRSGIDFSIFIRLGGDDGVRLVEGSLSDPALTIAALVALKEAGKLTWTALAPQFQGTGGVNSYVLFIIRDRRMTEAFSAVQGLLGSGRASDEDIIETLVHLDPEAARPILEQAVPACPAATARLDSVDLLTKLAVDPEPAIRLAALGRLVDLRAPGIGKLVAETMRSDPMELRAAAALGLGLLGEKEREGDLIEVLNTGDNQATSAAESLGRIGGPEALAALRASHRAGFEDVWTLARARLGDAEVASRLALMLRMQASPGVNSIWVHGNVHAVWRVSRPASEGLQEYAELLGGMGEAGVTELLALLKLPVEKVHPHVMAGLAVSKDPRARAALEAGLRVRHHAALRIAAARGLGRQGDAAAVALLEKALDDPVIKVREGIVDELQRLRSR